MSKIGAPYLWQISSWFLPAKKRKIKERFSTIFFNTSYLKEFSIEFRSEQADHDCLAESSDKDDSGMFHATSSQQQIILLLVVISPLG